MPDVPLRDQIGEVTRELGLRRRHYPRWVEGRTLTQAVADRQLARMEAVLLTLTQLHRDQAAAAGGVAGPQQGLSL